MGQCGCGDYYPDFKFEGPDGSLYTIQVYRGCPGCQTPMAILVSRLDSIEEIESWDAQHLRELPFKKIDTNFHEACLKVVDPMKVAKDLDLEHDRIEVYRALNMDPNLSETN